MVANWFARDAVESGSESPNPPRTVSTRQRTRWKGPSAGPGAGSTQGEPWMPTRGEALARGAGPHLGLAPPRGEPRGGQANPTTSGRAALGLGLRGPLRRRGPGALRQGRVGTTNGGSTLPRSGLPGREARGNRGNRRAGQRGQRRQGATPGRITRRPRRLGQKERRWRLERCQTLPTLLSRRDPQAA